MSHSKVWPWLEGGILATVVCIVLFAGGDAVRASYHGYLHTSIGESVLRDGLLPENPYHAGSTIRYYTLYPMLGPLLGKVGFGPIWGFALLNILAALLFGPAWNAFAKASGLNFLQRRASFWAAVLGFNALGWIGWLLWPPDPGLLVPVFSFESLTMGSHGLAWDARLQSFLPKFLNVSSFALALPFMLWAMAPAMAADGKAKQLVLPLAIALAINPLAGGFAVICIAVWQLPSLLQPQGQHRFAWPIAGVIAGACALPFVLPMFQPAPTGESLTGTVRFQHDGIMNFIGPMCLLLIPGTWGLWKWNKSTLRKWFFGLIVAVLIMAFARLPWGNQYKLARIAGLLWAIPVGRWAVAQWQGAKWQRLLPVAILALSLPTFLLVMETYLKWGDAAPATVVEVNGGELTLTSEQAARSWPAALQTAEQLAPANAVLWMHRNHPGSRAANGVVQGNALAPLLHHPLFVDRPQIHNNELADLPQRLQLSADFWGPQPSQSIQDQGPNSVQAATDSATNALRKARSMLADRPFLILTHSAFPWTIQAMTVADGQAIADENGFSLWLIPAAKIEAGN
jgi:hypothetical protein